MGLFGRGSGMPGVKGGHKDGVCFCYGCSASRNHTLAQRANDRGDRAEAEQRQAWGDEQLRRHYERER